MGFIIKFKVCGIECFDSFVFIMLGCIVCIVIFVFFSFFVSFCVKYIFVSLLFVYGFFCWFWKFFKLIVLYLCRVEEIKMILFGDDFFSNLRRRFVSKKGLKWLIFMLIFILFFV